MAASVFHPDLRAARFLPRGVGTSLAIWLARRVLVPTAKLPSSLTLTEHRIGEASVRVIAPVPSGAPRPALLWIHGGGYVMGAAKQDDALCARFAERLNLVVVSVDYRLAPEHPYPAALEDCFAAFTFLHRDADALGIDPMRVVIGGLSAGGGLAAALALRAHDRSYSGGDRSPPAPVLQLLAYPMIDDRTVASTHARPFHRIWDRASNERGWRAYLGRRFGADDVPDHAAPARRRDLSGLPPAWIGVGSLDLFHDEDVAYADRLRAAGVATELDVVEGAFHGFDAVLPNRPVSRRFFDAQVAAIAAAIR